jgi:hypothetical protein
VVVPNYFNMIPSEVLKDVAELAASIGEIAQTHSKERWGATSYSTGIRINVGWTEILTAYQDFTRLIVDGELALSTKLPSNTKLFEGKDERGFYPSIPGSLLAEIEYRPLAGFRRSLAALKPSLHEAIRLAARRTVGAGVREGHDPKLVIALSGIVGRALADPLSKTKVGSDQDLMEGALKRVVSSRFERNAAARRACIAHHGTSCGICAFSFQSIFGDLGVGFIHVHHVKPLAGLRREYRVDPVRDLLPICPNCHAMIHRQDPPIDVDVLRRQIRSAS